MISGRYEITLKSPLGSKKGELSLTEADGTLAGAMKLLGTENTLAGSLCGDNCFHFTGVLQTPITALRYECVGNVADDTLHGIVKTSKGDFLLTGSRKQNI